MVFNDTQIGGIRQSSLELIPKHGLFNKAALIIEGNALMVNKFFKLYGLLIAESNSQVIFLVDTPLKVSNVEFHFDECVEDVIKT